MKPKSESFLFCSHDREVALEVLKQLFRVCMLWEQSECLMHHSKTLLELSTFVVEVGQVEDGLEEVVGRLLRLLEVVLRLLNVCLAQLKHPQVIE